MDPEQAIKDLNEICAQYPDGCEDASNVAEDLYNWIERGGFVPLTPLQAEAVYLFPYLSKLQEREHARQENGR